jgi:hypothetical protein
MKNAKVPQTIAAPCINCVEILQEEDYSEEIRIINLKDTNREQEESSNNGDASGNKMVFFWIRNEHQYHCMFDEYVLYICINLLDYYNFQVCMFWQHHGNLPLAFTKRKSCEYWYSVI